VTCVFSGLLSLFFAADVLIFPVEKREEKKPGRRGFFREGGDGPIGPSSLIPSSRILPGSPYVRFSDDVHSFLFRDDLIESQNQGEFLPCSANPALIMSFSEERHNVLNNQHRTEGNLLRHL